MVQIINKNYRTIVGFNAILILLAVLPAGGCAVIMGVLNYRNDNYWKYAETTGEIETKYAAPGSQEVSVKEFSADGYMTAWFMYCLKGDIKAGMAFFGNNAEIISDKNWQDVKTNK